MTQTNQSADLLISHIIHGIEELKGQEDDFNGPPED